MKTLEVISIEECETPQNVYDISVEDESYLLENGLISHNSGGGGLKYAASTIIFLSKAKERDKNNEIVGNVITTTMVKSRLSKENTKGKTLLTYNQGLDRYYGLVELGLEGALFKKQGNKVLFPDGELAFASEIYKEPTSYFSNELLVKLDKIAAAKYKYGEHDIVVTEEDGEDGGPVT